MGSLEVLACVKSFETNVVLKKVKCACDVGEILAIFGRNGSGKSTLLRILFGTLNADLLQLKIDGLEVNAKSVIGQRYIAYLPQKSFLPKGLKVRSVIPMYFSEGQDQNKVFYAKGIPEMSNLHIGDLSIGQRRYLEVLLLGHLDHPFMMLDEPFSMVDPFYVELLKDFLTSLKDSKGIMITDHYYRDVWHLSDRRMLLHEGELSEVYALDALKEGGYLVDEVI